MDQCQKNESANLGDEVSRTEWASGTKPSESLCGCYEGCEPYTNGNVVDDMEKVLDFFLGCRLALGGFGVLYG